MRTLYFLLAMLLVATISVIVDRRFYRANPPAEIVVRHDTVPYYYPVIKDSTIVRYVKVPVPVRPDTSCNDTLFIEPDSISGDSADVVLPIAQKVYSDSCYTAWVSGFRPNLDSLKIYPRTTVVTHTVSIPQRRWSIGLQGGVGMTPKGVQPYLGVGVNFRIW